ncbi:MAG: hypothetical protein GY866_23890 [Proteobacteria bacterium]|nr:hypothetical protein [Pseudomonadota bacterium]
MNNSSLPYKELTISILARILYLRSPRTLSAKAKRQNWPYTQKSHAGSPIHLYDLSTLPNDVQIAWANWDENSYQTSVNLEMQKGEKSRPEKIPGAVTATQAGEVLSWPDRSSYYEHADASSNATGTGIGTKKYDGYSKGLCSMARKTLLKRFPKSSGNETPTAAFHQAKTYRAFTPETHTVEDPSTGYRIDQRPNDADILPLLNEKESIIVGLKEEISGLKEDKRILREYRNELKEEIEKRVAEKDRRIEEKDKLIAVLEETIQQLKEKIKNLQS